MSEADQGVLTRCYFALRRAGFVPVVAWWRACRVLANVQRYERTLANYERGRRAL
jgi:hypothetical protein